jgi:hypothetical protein
LGRDRGTRWATKERYDLYVSEAVLAEAGGGDPLAAGRRLSALANVPVLMITGEVGNLAARFVDDGALPRRAFVDALHVAAAALHGMDFLLTWNCAHIANSRIRASLESLCRWHSLRPPMICTPEELQT